MKRLLQVRIWFEAVAVMVLLVACTALGVPSPDTFNEKAAVALGTVTQVRATTLQLLQAKKITADDAQHVQSQADNARAGIDIARGLSKTDLTAAGNKLAMATAVLTAAQAYLATKGN